MVGVAGGLGAIGGQVVREVRGQSAGGQGGADSWPGRDSVRAVSGQGAALDRLRWTRLMGRWITSVVAGGSVLLAGG